jgi:plastocyanin
MKTVALSILAMGVSLALVIVVWIEIGSDPNYSVKQLQEQQSSLREQYGFPAQETSTAELEVPPSLRDLEGVAGNATSAASVASNATGGNQTRAMGNATAGNRTAGNQTIAANGTAAALASGGTAASIVEGATSKTNDAYNPNLIQIKAGDKVTWINNDSMPHTATSVKDGKPNGTFDSSTLTPGKRYSFTFEEAGDYPYFCTLHPNMAGTVSVS